MDANASKSSAATINVEGVEYDANGDIKFPRDRFFDPWRIARTEKLKGVVKEAQGMIAKYEDYFGLRKRARKKIDQSVFDQTIEAIICDMLFVYLSGEDRGSAVSLSNNVLGTRSRYRSPVFSKQLPDILRAMAPPEMDFIGLEIGWQKNFANRGQRTLIRPGWRIGARVEEHGICLSDIGRRPFSELIVLKAPKQDYWDEGQYQDYDDDTHTAAMRYQVAEINEWLDQAEMEIADLDLASKIQSSDRSLRRVFTRGSFESGGRLFGGFWQQMKKDDRLECIAINGEGVSGLDFGQIAVRIAYGLVGVQPPDGDLYQIADYHPVYREGIKVLLNALLSAQKPIVRKPKGSKDLLPNRPLSVLIGDISAKHPAIAPLFFTAACHRLQFLESQILVEVLLRLKREGIVGLPIHDGLVVPCEAEDRARYVMEAVAFDLTGVSIPLRTDS